MNQKYEKVEKEFQSGLDKVKNIIDNKESSLSMQGFRLTTMTILVYLNFRINLSKFNSNFKSIDWIINTSGCFYNSILLTNNRTTKKGKESKEGIAIKVFSNGNLHMTGARSVKHALEIGTAICSLLDDSFGIEKNEEGYTIEDFDIQLRNGCFKYDLGDKYIVLKDMLQILLEKTTHLCVYNNDSHAGLRIKIVNENCEATSIIVFESGNVLLNAFKTGKDLLDAFTFINNFICQHSAEILKSSVTSKSKKANNC